MLLQIWNVAGNKQIDPILSAFFNTFSLTLKDHLELGLICHLVHYITLNIICILSSGLSSAKIL